MNINEQILAEVYKRYPDQKEFRKKTVESIAKELGFAWPQYAELFSKKHNVRHGVYTYVENITRHEETPVETVYVPRTDPTFVEWGNYSTILKIIKSRKFFPTFITGLTGNGKTLCVEQACAALGREYVRIQLSTTTDADDLIGGMRLVNGSTVFEKGPVIKAMESGAILLMDEMDRASNKLLVMMGVLEGKPVHIAKTGEIVVPAPGFNVIATANTKGRGSDSGHYTAATLMDEAFLERFVVTIDQSYPPKNIEHAILIAHAKAIDADYSDTEFLNHLVNWSDTIRTTFESGGVDDVISTRRLCHIVQTYAMLGDRGKAVSLCISRFQNETRDAFYSLYTKLDKTVT